MPSERYIGLTGGGSEPRDANHLSLSHKSAELEPTETLYHQKFAATNGGPGMFIDMPLLICPANTERSDALRLERWYYTRFGTHNHKPGRLRDGARQHNDRNRSRRRKQPRRRPVMSLRAKSGRIHSLNATNVGTVPMLYYHTKSAANAAAVILLL
eukprot:SAG11_NODE_553_length_8575_cov_18.074328_4_plen_156_part_00